MLEASQGTEEITSIQITYCKWYFYIFCHRGKKVCSSPHNAGLPKYCGSNLWCKNLVLLYFRTWIPYHILKYTFRHILMQKWIQSNVKVPIVYKTLKYIPKFKVHYFKVEGQKSHLRYTIKRQSLNCNHLSKTKSRSHTSNR